MSDGQRDTSPRTEGSRTVTGQRVLHALLPEAVFNHVKAQAALSGMAFKEYLERYLREAAPYTAKDLQNANVAMLNSDPS